MRGFTNRSINIIKRSFSVVLIILISSQSYAHSSTIYSISSAKDKIGELTVTKTKKDDFTTIVITSDCIVKKLFAFNISYTLTSVYKKNELHSNSILTYMNGKLNSTMETTRIGDIYKFTKDGKESTYQKKINYSEALLYYKEPLDSSRIYSEFDGVEKSIDRPENQHYKILNPLNGHVSEYFYKNGLLDRAIVHYSLMTFFIAKQEKLGK